MPASNLFLACMASLFLAASGAAILNNVLDAERDRSMARLAKRSAAMERIGEKTGGTVAVTAILASLWLAATFITPLTAILLLAAVLGYTPLYTLLLKRRSPYGAVPGGLSGALPVLIGSAAAGSPMNIDAIILFTLMLLWQPPHFWALALHYRDDYKAAGLPVLPVARGTTRTKQMILLFATAQIPVSLALWLVGGRSLRFAAAALLLSLLFAGSCAWDIAVKNRYRRGFAVSLIYLVLLLATFISDSLLPS
jgi:protoheme IX farnesyltransferase